MKNNPVSINASDHRPENYEVLKIVERTVMKILFPVFVVAMPLLTSGAELRSDVPFLPLSEPELSIRAGPDLTNREARMALTDDEARFFIHYLSIEAFGSQNCPCPDRRKQDGTLCGDDSAYSRGEEDAPLCDIWKITDDMVKRFRETGPGG